MKGWTTIINLAQERFHFLISWAKSTERALSLSLSVCEPVERKGRWPPNEWSNVIFLETRLRVTLPYHRDPPYFCL